MLELTGSGQSAVAQFYLHGDALVSFIEVKINLHLLRDYHILNENAA